MLQPGLVGEVIEEADALSHQLDFFRIVELKPEGTRRDRSSKRGKSRPFLQDDRLEAGAGGAEGGRAADDAAADDGQLCRLGRLAHLDDQHLHRPTGRLNGNVVSNPLAQQGFADRRFH